MDTNDANDQAVNTRDNEAAPFFSADKDRRHDGEKTRKIIQPEHPHSAPPIQMANGREEVICITCALRLYFVTQMACQIALVGSAECPPIEINQLETMGSICGPRMHEKWRHPMTIFRHGGFRSSRGEEVATTDDGRKMPATLRYWRDDSLLLKAGKTGAVYTFSTSPSRATIS